MNNSKQLDFLHSPIDVEESPKWQRRIDMHQSRNVVTISSVVHFTVLRQLEHELVADFRTGTDIFVDDPVFRSVKKQVGIVGKKVRSQGRRVTAGHSECQAAIERRINCNNVNAECITRLTRGVGEHKSITVLVCTSDRNGAVLSDKCVSASNAGME